MNKLGNSGATIVAHGNIVVKVAGPELMEAAARQEAFHDEEVQTPMVLAKFLSGSTGMVAMERVDDGVGQWTSAVGALLRYVRRCYRTSTTEVIQEDALRAKLRTVMEGAERRAALLGTAMSRLAVPLAIVNRLAGEAYQANPMSHGDLTLCNTIPTRDGPVVLDFHPRPWPCGPLVDLVKLRQDTCHGWINLLSPGHIRRPLLKELDDQVREAVADAPDRALYQAFQALNLLRLLPYAKTKDIFHHILRELGSCTP